MADSMDKAVATRHTQWGRWKIVREVQFPATKSTRRRKDGSVQIMSRENPSAKAVLLDLAQWDDPDKLVYKGVANIAAATGLSTRAVDKALNFLEASGILDRKARGLGMTKRSVLDWDAIEKLRKPFRERMETQATTEATAESAPAEPKKIAQPSPIAAKLLALPHIGRKLTPKDSESVTRTLLRKHVEDETYLAIDRLTDETLASAAGEDKENHAGYLLRCVEKEIGGVHEYAATLVVGIKDGDIPAIVAPTAKPKESIQHALNLLTRLGGGEFTFSAIQDDGDKWSADVIMPALPNDEEAIVLEDFDPAENYAAAA